MASIYYLLILTYPWLVDGLSLDADGDSTQSNVLAFLDMQPKNKLWNRTRADYLKRHLLTNYERNERPFDGTQSGVRLTPTLTVKKAHIDEMSGVLTICGWMVLEWQDDRLKWNESDYGDMKVIHMTKYDIWHPDIFLIDGAELRGEKPIPITEMSFMVSSKGEILVAAPYNFKVFCSLNLRLWPADVQTCYLKIGSWVSYNFDAVRYIDDQTEFNGSIHEWYVTSIKSLWKEAGPGINHCVIFDVTVERRASGYFKAIFIAPAVCVAFLTLAGFWLPPQVGEKILINAIVLVIISSVLLHFAEILPVLESGTPLMVLFYSNSLVLVAISTFISVLVIYNSTTTTDRHMPQFWKNLWYLHGRRLANFLCLSCWGPDDDDVSVVPDSDLEAFRAHLTQMDWVLLTTAIDRILFFVYSAIFATLILAFVT